MGEARDLEDSERAMQDATAQNRIDYILIIPAGYGEEVRRTVRAGGEPPRMDTVIGYESASGALMNVRIDSYAGQVVDYLSAVISLLRAAPVPRHGAARHERPAHAPVRDPGGLAE